MLYSYNECESYVVIALKDKTYVVLNAKSDAKTKELYEKISDYV